MANDNETVAEIISKMREPSIYKGRIPVQRVDADFRYFADRIEEAHKREMSKLCPKTGGDFGQFGNAAKLPDGWKMYDKYQIRHTDGTPLKGKRYFVLRLDSDDPLEAARVAAAMSAYKGETPQSNVAKMREACEMFVAAMEYEKCIHETMLTEAYQKAKAALAAPRLNYEVGTAEEQSERFHDFCVAHQSEIDGMCSPSCPCIGLADKCHCLTHWAQMPYPKGGAKWRK